MEKSIMERWTVIPDFPSYSVSSYGRIRTDKTGRILQAVQNQYDVLMVGMMRDGTQYKRSVALLVADAFIPKPAPHFDTPINLNGHRVDCKVSNLAWRPRWYAVLYNKQFNTPYDNPITKPIRDIKTKAVYPNSFAVAVHLGLLEKDVVLSILNRTVVWITYQQFEMVED